MSSCVAAVLVSTAEESGVVVFECSPVDPFAVTPQGAGREDGVISQLRDWAEVDVGSVQFIGTEIHCDFLLRVYDGSVYGSPCADEKD